MQQRTDGHSTSTIAATLLVLVLMGSLAQSPSARAAPAGPRSLKTDLPPREASPENGPRRLGGLSVADPEEPRLRVGTVLLPPGANGGPATDQTTSGQGTTNFLAAMDADGDGLDELLQQTDSFGTWWLGLTDPRTGGKIWSIELGPPITFYMDVVPSTSGAGHDVLWITSGRGPWRIQLIDGRDGTVRWTSVGDALLQTPLNYYGLSKNGGGFDLVTAFWGGLYAAVGGSTATVAAGHRTLTVEMRDLESGTVRKELTLHGANVQPSVALAGDLDGDGIGDLYTLEPAATSTTLGCPPDCAAVGLIRAVTAEGDAGRASHTPLAADGLWLWPRTWDLSGDGVPDPVVFSDFMGNIYSCERSSSSVAIIDGAELDGEATTVYSRSLPRQVVWDITSPGDIDGDGVRDIVASGWQFWCDTGRVMFEALGKNGYLWHWEFLRHYREWGGEWAWWPDAGDLDGDGVRDAIVRFPYSERAGTYRIVAIDQSSAPGCYVPSAFSPCDALFDVDDPPSGWIAPLGTDADGDGAADLIAGFGQDHSEEASTIRFTMTRGDLSPLWDRPHVRTLPGGPYSVWLATGRFTGETVSLTVDYSAGGSHTRELLDGATGDPA